MTGEAIARAAEELVGTPFRLHGRDASTGLDCIGVIHAALRAAGKEVALPNGYQLRSRSISGLNQISRACGFSPAMEPVRPGDVILVKTAPCQFHFLVSSLCGGFVHAHAGIRRVVLTPPPLSWPILGHWRCDQPN